MLNKNDWNARAEKYGHTGHSEPFYYCFDQQARLFAMEQILNSCNIEKNLVLDFGCGSGDFLNLLQEHFKNVSAYDFSEVVLNTAKKRFADSKITFAHTLTERITEKRYDVILTVTVLQNLNSASLKETVGTLSNLLTPNGKMICMEFFLPNNFTGHVDGNPSNYTDWNDALNKHKLKVETKYNFYNPIVAPSYSWRKYKNNIFFFMLRPFKKLKLVQHLFSNYSKKLIQKHKDVITKNETGLSIFVVSKLEK